MSINNYGWNQFYIDEWNNKYSENFIPARIIADYGVKISVMTDQGEMLIPRFISNQDKDIQLAVGDWVALMHDKENDITHVESVLTRRTKFSRAAAGIELKEQIVATNIDTVFIVQSLDNDFNIRRLERYLIASWESGAMPVIILTKSDCCENTDEKISIAMNCAPGVPIHAISALTGEGIDDIMQYIKKEKTVALIGSSGVGKSTLINTLAGAELFKTQQVRQSDSRGRHTTTHRQLVLLPNGAIILDTPGMRSLSLWEAESGIETMFSDIEELAKKCYFRDCSHKNEPNCAIQKALDDGSLDKRRWESWQKLQKELMHLEKMMHNKQRLQEKQASSTYKTNKKVYNDTY